MNRTKYIYILISIAFVVLLIIGFNISLITKKNQEKVNEIRAKELSRIVYINSYKDLIEEEFQGRIISINLDYPTEEELSELNLSVKENLVRKALVYSVEGVEVVCYKFICFELEGKLKVLNKGKIENIL